MKRLENALRNSTLDVKALRAYYSEELCEMVTALLAKKRGERIPLARLLEQLTEAPKVPSTWGLSAEAQAAFEAMHEVSKEDGAEGGGASAGGSGGGSVSGGRGSGES